MHPADLDNQTLWEACDASAKKASGPGGQRRNKVQTAVVLTHRATGLTAQASERRSREENRRVALRRLRMQLALHVRTERKLTEGGSALWKSRCRGGVIALNQDHHDVPSMIAEALDVIEQCRMDHARAADVLGCSATQLVKLLKLEPEALAQLNDSRVKKGKRPLM
ncbi:MAG: peptide chain release factor-like protein [Phycisphaera sp.]|nr:peptide chain release factor-like protein [Phycisphaera sp.]